MDIRRRLVPILVGLGLALVVSYAILAAGGDVGTALVGGAAVVGVVFILWKAVLSRRVMYPV